MPTTNNAARGALHDLVDALPEGDVATARRLLEALAATANDELSAEDETAIRTGLASLARGEGVPATEAFARWRRTAP